MAETDRSGSRSSSGDWREARLYAEAILRTMRQPLVVLNGDLTVDTANDAFYGTFKVEPAETRGRKLYELGNNQWDIPELRRLLEEILPNNGEITDSKVEHEFEDIGRRVMILNANRIERGDHDDLILLAIDDITEREHTRWLLEGQKEFSDKIIDASRDALLILGWDLRVKMANETFYHAFKVEPSETEGRMVYELGDGQWNIPELRELLENVLPDNDAFDDFEVDHDFPEIGRRIMVLNGRRVDHMKFILLAIEDQTEARRATAALKESEEKFRVLVEAASRAVWDTDPHGAMVADSPSWRAFTGQSREQWLGEGWAEAVHPKDRDGAVRAWREAVAAERNLDTEFRLRRPEGGWRWARLRAAPVRDGQGRILRWVGMASDISARKDAEEQRELLLGELNHRVKNIFSIIRSLAVQGDGERSISAFREAFLGRLDALVHAHALALESRWENVDLARLAEETMRPYAAQRPGAVEISGDRFMLEPRTALSFSLVLHELATNAVKYGALSSPEGRLRLCWSTTGKEPRMVRFEWRESGGPPVTRPERQGFGTRLVGRVFDYELGGEADFDYREHGLRMEAWFPLG